LPFFGYNEDATDERCTGQGLTAFIQKPYQLDTPTWDPGEAV
jgi:hypothetical protein